MTLIWPFNATQGQMSWGKLKDHIYDLLWVYEKNYMMLHLGDTTFLSHTTFWRQHFNTTD